MQALKDQINGYLSCLKGSGKFCSIHAADFVFPQLHINGIGELGFPINEVQAGELIKIAHKAPFGKGMETVLDTNVRSAWQIDASELHFEGENWTKFLDKALVKIKEDLGIMNAKVSAHLYKMLVYEEGDFFLKHKDTEKEKGMFGTLIFGLPSVFTGGELVLSFEGEEHVADFAKDPYRFNCTAFYADCDHEVKPLLSGYRICLVYNLVQEKDDNALSPLVTKSHVDNLAKILAGTDGNQPLIILLGHQYTPENFSPENLKLNDRLKADVLLKAADRLGFYSKLCLVTSFVSGSPQYDGYYDGDEEDDSLEMGEVNDEWLEIEHWLSNATPPLSNLRFSEENLIASFPINDGEPLVAENTGYMGNYGPDINHWYHYGALVIWSKEVNAQLLAAQKIANILEWISYFTSLHEDLSPVENKAIEAILKNGLGREQPNERISYDAIGDWVINNKPDGFLIALDPTVLRFYFEKIGNQKWLEVLEKCRLTTQEYFFAEIEKEVSRNSVEKWLALCRLSMQNHKLTGIVPVAFTNATTLLKILFEKNNDKKSPITPQMLNDLIALEENLSKGEEWSHSLAEILTDEFFDNYMHQVLGPILLQQPVKNTFVNLLLERSRTYLQYRADNKPQPPANWVREVPSKKGYEKQWTALRPFLEDPEMQTMDFRKNQNERAQMESAILNVVIDLKTETIRKGSPHILRITKTQDAYKRAMKIWEEDVKLLEKITLV